MKTFKYISLIAVSLLISCALNAQSISVQLSSDQVSVGQSFLVTYSMDGNLDDFTLPDFGNEFEVYTSGKSTNVSIINGKVSKSVSINITVNPLVAGKYEIGPAKAVFNGKKISSPPFTIEVLNSSNAPRSQNTPQQNNSSPPPSGQQKIDRPSDNWKDNILLLAKTDKSQMYVGEQATITYILLRRLDYQSMEVEKLPVYKGFLSEEMEIPNQKSEGVMEYNGHKYYFQAFKKVALFATQPGVQSIDPMIAKGVILIPELDPFFGTTFFSNSQPKMVSIASNILKINVIPLPTQPENFSGAVGQFQVQRSIDRNRLSKGESIDLKVEVSGWGNLKNIVAPKISTDSKLEVYEPEIKDQNKNNGEIFGGVRTFNYALVPQFSGKIVIPADEFVYFDPEQKTYIHKEMDAIALDVSPSISRDNKEGSAQNFQAQIKGQMQEEKSFPLPLAIAVFSGLPFIALIGLFAWKRKSKFTVEPSPNEIDWKTILHSPQNEQYALLAKTLRLQLQSKFKMNSTIDNDILEHIQDDDLRKKMDFILQSCDRAAYSPLQSISVEELVKLTENCWSQIQKIEIFS